MGLLASCLMGMIQGGEKALRMQEREEIAEGGDGRRAHCEGWLSV